jgi:monoamine oxidase
MVLDPTDLGVSSLDMTESGRVVVVGAGLAGLRTAELRSVVATP